MFPGKDVDEDYVEYKPKKVKAEPEISKADIRIIEDIHAMKDAEVGILEPCLAIV